MHSYRWLSLYGRWDLKQMLTCAISPAPFYFILKIWIILPVGVWAACVTWCMRNSDNLLEKRGVINTIWMLRIKSRFWVRETNVRSSGAMLSFHFQCLNFYSSTKVLWILDLLWCPGCWGFRQATPTSTQFWPNFEFIPRTRTMVFLQN